MFSGRLNMIRACQSQEKMNPSKIAVLCDQILDSFLVGGITGVSAYLSAGETASLKAACLAFLLTFLIKMKEYRKIT